MEEKLTASDAVEIADDFIISTHIPYFSSSVKAKALIGEYKVLFNVPTEKLHLIMDCIVRLGYTVSSVNQEEHTNTTRILVQW